MKCIVLDDGKKYIIVNKFVIDDTRYALFSNLEDYKKLCFRKVKEVDGKEYYVGLDNKEEFEKVSGFASVNLK